MRFLISLAAIAVLLVITSEMAERDQRIADLERAHACRPARNGDLATLTLRRGRYECALITRQAGRLRVAYRSLNDD